MSAEQARKIEVTGESQGPVPIDVQRGIGQRVLNKIGLDRESLREAGVIRTHEAQASEDIARGLKPAETANVGPQGQTRAENLIDRQKIRQFDSGHRYH